MLCKQTVTIAQMIKGHSLSWKKIRSLKRSSSASIRKVSVAKILLMPLLNLRKH
ncbi:hypothetical protein SGB_03578 [Shigella boydii ATCC 9905]|nr:hypothetical protein SGB_03578 [Shigella boydii ATCC 9905]